MLLDQAHQWLGWPSPERILDPQGAGARATWEFAKRKIRDSLKQKFPGIQVETGILVLNSDATETSAPLAVVCQFPAGASDEALNEAHRLAWSSSRTSLLVTLEPRRIIAWTCHCDPNQSEQMRKVCELPTPPGFTSSGDQEQRHVRDLLHWVSLITGHIQQQRPEHFRADGRADALLLKNLRFVRGELITRGLPQNFCHDLLARIVFTQYLFHRRDADGSAFFTSHLLDRLKNDGTLKTSHGDLGAVLQDHDATYALFRRLDERFNGDLFPGKEDASAAERDAAWKAESDAVRPEHLRLLADLVSGTIDTTDRQLLLWPQYSFDTIPLEFISSVYEEFLNEEKYATKAFYTPSHLVDYVLDAVLPWDGDEWDLRILDPSCGSGIFLVKAFQRLIYRWRRAHGREPLVSDLKPLLAKNLTGVDINPEAVRVACFSLYLAMADAIEPKHYVTREKVFPRLRGKRLIPTDFFDAKTSGFLTDGDRRLFDLVIGNAPWGDKSIKKTSHGAAASPTNCRQKKQAPATNAEAWAKERAWPIVNHDIGPLFLARGLDLVRDDGKVAMVQPAGPWLYHRSEPAIQSRKRLFETCTVDEITNLSAIRRELFIDAIGPACIIVVGTGPASPESEISYFAPKPLKTGGGQSEFVIEPQDAARITHREAACDPLVWPVLSMGGRRDLNLIRRLSSMETLAKLTAKNQVMTRMGVIPGDKKKLLLDLKDKPYFDATEFPANVFLELDAANVPGWKDPRVDSLHGIKHFEEFKQPQLLIKQSLSSKTGRFRAALVRSDDPEWGVVCKETYLSVRDQSPDSRHIQAACLVYNSLLASYFLALTSSRVGHYRPETLARELVTVPLPNQLVDLARVGSFDEIDELTRRLFSLTQAEWAVIEDFLSVMLPDAIRMTRGPGRATTRRHESHDGNEPELSIFAQTMLRVLKSTFGSDKAVTATIYQDPRDRPLPVRMVTLHFDWPGRNPLTVTLMEADGLLDELAKFHQDALQHPSPKAAGGVGFQRVAYFFHSTPAEHGRVRSLTIIKPDERRYWTRSSAMRDADDLAAAIIKAAGWEGQRA